MTTWTPTWPPAPTLHEEPPADHLYRSALWLCGRYPRLVALVERAGAAPEDEAGRWLDLDLLAAAINGLDDYLAAWEDYRRRTYEPQDDAAWQRWEAKGPRPEHPLVENVITMSRTEQTRLRLLAFFSSDRVRLRVSDLGGLDDEGQALVADWTRALLAA